MLNVHGHTWRQTYSADGFLLASGLPFRLDRCSFVRSFSSAITVSVISFSSHSLKGGHVMGTTISHYSALWNPAPMRNPGQRDKILEKLGEVPKWLTSVSQRVIAILRIPPLYGGSCIMRCQ